MLHIRGAREHNLKNISLSLPKNKFIAFCGPSGSGKSSLAIATIYAEAQRRFIESLSPSSRMFLEKLQKPNIDSIQGLSPAICIDQIPPSHHPKSTVASTSDIADFLRILFAIVGVPHDPETHQPLEKLSSDQITQAISKFPEGSKIHILSPLPPAAFLDFPSTLLELQRQGFLRIQLNSKILELDDPSLLTTTPTEARLVVDRLILRESTISRLADSIEAALKISSSEIIALIQIPESSTTSEHHFTTKFYNPQTGFTLSELSPSNFSPNSASGACLTCHGLGEIFQAKILNPSLSLLDGAISPKKSNAFSSALFAEFLSYLKKSDQLSAIANKPIQNFSQSESDFFFFGNDEFPGFNRLAESVFEATPQSSRKSLAKHFTKQICPDCQGNGLRPEFLSVTLPISAPNIPTFLNFPNFLTLDVTSAISALSLLPVPPERAAICNDVLTQLTTRLQFLSDIGLDYLALNRPANSLSGGEAQRLRLATQLGSGLSGIIYILDEPSIGLHPADSQKLISAIKHLRDLGNTVIVIEHDSEILSAADQIVDFGPSSGTLGGEILAQGTLAEIRANPISPTGAWLAKRNSMPNLPPLNNSKISTLTLQGASLFNLKNITVSFPTQRLVTLAGPSGSGKSTLIKNLLVPAIQHELNPRLPFPTHLEKISGHENIKRLILIDQSPLGRSARSNVATATELWDLIRQLFASLPLSKQRGYTPTRFSFNVAGGRCDHCNGTGKIALDLQFLPPAPFSCPVCHGARFNRQTLEVSWHGKNPTEILNLTIAEALSFFQNLTKISAILKILNDLGLGYLPLGQPTNELSGGEAQRIKIAAELAHPTPIHTLFILDEPTTGLHFNEISRLLSALFALRQAGHSLLVIEHNLDVLAASDWIIELGPNGGKQGGNLIASCPPHDLIKIKSSPTAPFLKKILL